MQAVLDTEMLVTQRSASRYAKSESKFTLDGCDNNAKSTPRILDGGGGERVGAKGGAGERDYRRLLGKPGK